jgi:putative PIN family toxin of toxin-antitoxin system
VIRAVIDTNVLVSGLLSPAGNEALILLAINQGLVRPCCSEDILEEYAVVLAQPKFAVPPKTTGHGRYMAKPILDAMEGIVYTNDKQVKNLHAEWCDIEGSYIVRFMSPIVAAALSAGKEFLWVRVSPNAPRQDLTR